MLASRTSNFVKNTADISPENGKNIVRRGGAEHKNMAQKPMITANLRAELEFCSVGKNRVGNYMKKMGLKC